MAWMLRILSKEGVVKNVPLNQRSAKFAVEPNASYELVPPSGGPTKPLSLKRLVKKNGVGQDDLEVIQDGESILSLTDFFGSDGNVQLLLPNAEVCANDAGLVRVTPKTSFDQITGQVLFNTTDGASCAPAVTTDGLGGMTSLLAGATFLGGAVAVANGLASADSPVVNAVQVNFIGGPALPNHTLEIELYAADGRRLLGTGQLDEQGQITIEVGDYTGVVIVRLIDRDDGPDYLDEVAGEKDLNASLWAMGQIVQANSIVYLNINALTTIAFDKAQLILTEEQVLTPILVTAVNDAVAQAFGLEDVHNTPIIATNSDEFDPTDTSEGELYGQILAYLAGLDAINSGDTQATINAFVGNAPNDGWLEINTVGSTLTAALTDEGDEALFVDGVNQVALPEAYVTGIAFDGAVGFQSALSSQLITGQLNGSLLPGHSLMASLDGGLTWVNLSDMPGVINGSQINWSVNIAGGSLMIFKVIDEAGNQGPVSTQAYEFTGVIPTTTISGLDISNDTGTSATDFVTNASSQTVTGTLSAALGAGEKLYGTVDNGANWIDISSYVTDRSISWTGVTLSGASTLKVEVRNAIGNAGISASQPYDLDTTSPTTTISGLDISNDTGTSATDFVTNASSQTVTGTLSTALGAGEKLYGTVDNGANWIDISSYVTDRSISWTGVTLSGASTLKVQVRDAAGNVGTAASVNYELDTSAPSTPAAPTSYADDVGSVTSTTSTASSTDDTKPGIVVGANLTTTPTLYVNGVAVSASYDATAGTLTPTNALSAGTYALTYTLKDLAGNESAPSGALNVTVDTTSPTTTISGLDISNDTGTSATDFVTNASSQTVTGTLSTALGDGEKLYGTVDNGANWIDISSYVTDRSISWTGVTLSGASTLKVEVRNAIGNAGISASQPYDLDTTSPTTTISGLDISNDTGTSATDFVTNASSQTVTGTLSTALGAGEKLYGTVDNGANWIDISSYVTDRSISWTGVTLSGASTLKVQVRDAAGNVGTAASVNYELDTSAPSTPAAPTSYADDVGSVTSTTSTASSTDDTKPGIVVGANLTTTPTLYVNGVAVSASYDATAGTLTPTNALSAGTYALTYTLKDLAGNESAPSGALNVTVVLAPTTTISALDILSDTGSSASDFITQTAAQTVTGTLSAALGDGEKLYGTVDNGANWIDISSYVTDRSISWTGVTLSGTSTLKLEVRDDEDRPGPTASANYEIDNTGPTLSTITDNFSGSANGEITYRFTFDEAVSGFTADDISITAGTKGAFVKVSNTEYTLKVTPPLIGGEITTSVTGSFTDLAGNSGTAAVTNLQESTGLTEGQAVIDLGGSNGKLIKPVYVDGKWYYYWDRNGSGTTDGSDTVDHNVLDQIFVNNVSGGVNPGSNTTDIYRYATINGLKIALPTIGNPDFIETSGPYTGLFYETKVFSNSSSDTTNYVIGTAIDNDPAGEINTEYDDLMAIWDAYNTSSPYRSDGLPPDWYPFGYWSATESVFGHAYIAFGSGLVYDSRDDAFARSVAVEVIFPV